MIRICAVIFGFMLLAACEYIPDWIGAAEDDSGISGENRISVLQVVKGVTPNVSVSDIEVLVPKAAKSIRWYKSDGYDALRVQNPDIPEEFINQSVVRAGKRTKFEQHFSAAPIVAGRRVFTIDYVGRVAAWDVHNVRRMIWKYKIDVPEDKDNFINAGMLYHRSKLIISSGYNKIVALDAESGNVLWERVINSIARAAPAAYNNIVFINTIDNKLYALDFKDGAILWSHSGLSEEISVFGSASPTVADRIVFNPHSSGELYALDVMGGKEVWYDSLGFGGGSGSFSLGDIDASPVVVGDRLFAVSNNGVLTAANMHTGRRLWEQEVSGTQTPWYAGDFLYLVNSDEQVICVHALTGGIKWVVDLPKYRKPEYKIGAITWSGPVMAGGKILVVGSHGRLFMLSPSDGKVVARYEVPKKIFLPPVVAYGKVFLYSDKAELVVME